MSTSAILPPVDHYEACQYVVRNPVTWNPAATSAADFDGCQILAIGDRVLCPSGTYAGIRKMNSTTVAIVDPGFDVYEGLTVRCVRSENAPTYQQMSSSAPANFRRIEGASISRDVIASGTGEVSITTVDSLPGLPFAVPESSLVTIEVDAQFSSNGGTKVWIGGLVGTAKRVGSGALAVTSQTMTVPLELTDSSWDPNLTENGNNVELRITRDALHSINPRGSVRITTVSMAQDAVMTDLQAARAAALADSYDLLYYSDVGLTPASPSEGQSITAWVDQSGHVRSASFSSGDQPKYLLDSTIPCLECLAADTPCGATSYTPAYNTARAFRWTMRQTAPTVASCEILFVTNAQLYLLTKSDGAGASPGTHIAICSNAAVSDLGVCPSGKHDFELVLSGTQATLYVDGVAGSPVSCAMPTSALAPVKILGYNSSLFPVNAHVFGIGYKEGSATQAQRDHWIAMSQLAWGAHD